MGHKFAQNVQNKGSGPPNPHLASDSGTRVITVKSNVFGVFCEIELTVNLLRISQNGKKPVLGQNHKFGPFFPYI